MQAHSVSPFWKAKGYIQESQVCGRIRACIRYKIKGLAHSHRAAPKFGPPLPLLDLENTTATAHGAETVSPYLWAWLIVCAQIGSISEFKLSWKRTCENSNASRQQFPQSATSLPGFLSPSRLRGLQSFWFPSG